MIKIKGGGNMEHKQYYDISEVCNILGVTSRTLRFYETKGIIYSTTAGISSRRKYTVDQISHIRNVLVLRTLGLSIKSIAELQNQGGNLRDAVLEKRAEIIASIDSRINEINLLNEALSALESGKNIFGESWHHHPETVAPEAEELETARLCTEAILNGDDDILYGHFSPRLAEYLPKSAYQAVRKDTFAPIGELISVEKTVAEEKLPNIINSYIRFSKLGLRIKFVFYSGKIDGLWLEYYDINSGWRK